MAGFAALLVLWSLVIGVPNDTGGVVLWVWFGTIAWNIDAPGSEHLDFWRDWWRPLLVLVVYWLLRGLADEIGTPVHYTMPIRFDEWLGGGVTPTERLQSAWCGDPCLKTMPPRWYDVLFTTVYASHFLVGLTVAGVLWVRNRAEWVLWMRRFVSLHVVALVLFWTYPMAPPWMAARDGYLGEVHRVSSRGWSEIDLHRQTMVLFGMANKSAAMPSLHAGLAFLLAFFASRGCAPVAVAGAALPADDDAGAGVLGGALRPRRPRRRAARGRGDGRLPALGGPATSPALV